MKIETVPQGQMRRGLLRIGLIMLASLAGLLTLLQIGRFQSAAVSASPFSSLDYETRKSELITRTQQPFVDDPLRNVESPLDRVSFAELNKLACPKLIDNPNGWSIETRTGGRPFMNFDDIEVNGTPWNFTPCTTGTSTITQSMLDEHYNVYAKTVNRFWFVHPSSNGYPIVLVMTPDGFFNAAGATGSTNLGAAARIGFIGEPFSPTMDYLQHIDEVSIYEIDDDTLLIVANIHSEAGEGVLQIELIWDGVNERPVLHMRSALMTRSTLPQPVNRIGFAGYNFMRGPTLSGLLSQFGTPEGGIEAFHDGRSLFLVRPEGSVTRNLLVPPVLTTTVVREDIATQVITGSRLVLDQPQDVQNYFSKFPAPGYETRTDLVLSLDETPGPVQVRRAQIAVDLVDVNPEANETVNVFYATDMISLTLYEFGYTLQVAAADYEEQYQARPHGVVFASDRSENQLKLFFLPLDANYLPAGAPIPLTDGVPPFPAQPSASDDGRYLLYDAADYGVNNLRRIYLLDMTSGAVQRRTVDPFGASNDFAGALNPQSTLFAMTTDRQGGSPFLNIESVSSGLGSGVGNAITRTRSVDWSPTRDELVLATPDTNRLRLYNQVTQVFTTLVTGPELAWPKFSPSGDQILYVAAASSELFITDRTGSSNTSVLTQTNYAAWLDETHLVVNRSSGANFDLFLVDITAPQVLTPLTSYAGFDIEPTYLPALPPTIQFVTPAPGTPVSGAGTVSGLMGAVGAPAVTVNGVAAFVNGDVWTATLPITLPGIYTATATITDTVTGLTAQDMITLYLNTPVQLAISKLSNEADLNWLHVGGNIDRYEVVSGTAPYFSPIPPTATKVTDVLPLPGWQLGTPVNYTDNGSGVGNPAVNHFYVVKVIVGPTETVSNRVGEFDFTIVPGS